MRFRFTVQREMAKLPSPFSQTQESGSPNKIQIKGRAMCQDQGPGGSLRGALGVPLPKDGGAGSGDPSCLQGCPGVHGPAPVFCSRSLCKTPIFSPKSCGGEKLSVSQSGKQSGDAPIWRECPWSPGHSYPAPSSLGRQHPWVLRCCWCQAAPARVGSAQAQPRAAVGALVPAGAIVPVGAIVPAHAQALSSLNNGRGEATRSQHPAGRGGGRDEPSRRPPQNSGSPFLCS